MSIEDAKDLLILIYIEIKFRKKSELLIINEEFLQKEKQSLQKNSIFTIAKYIYDYINILVDTKAEEKFKERKKFLIDINRSNSPLEYEKLLIKAERDLREHIKFEEQLKIRIEELEFELDDIKTGKNKKDTITYKSILTMTSENDKKNKNTKKITNKKHEKNSKKILQNIPNNNYNTIDNNKTKQNIMHKRRYSRIFPIKKKHFSHKSNILLSNNFYIFPNNTNSNISQKNSFLKFKSLINSTKKNKKTLKKISTESISISYSSNKNQKPIKYYSRFRKNPNLANLLGNNKLCITKIMNNLKMKCKKINNISNNINNNIIKKYNVQKTFQKFYNPNKMRNIVNMKKKVTEKKSKSYIKTKYNACKTERMEDSYQNLSSKPKNYNQASQNNTYCITSMISEDYLGPFRTGGNISKVWNSKEKSSGKKKIKNMKLKKKLMYSKLSNLKKNFRCNTHYFLTEYSIKKLDK